MSFLIFISVLALYWVFEPAIDSLCYAIASVFAYTPDTIVLVSGTLSATLAVLAYILAYWACKKWQHRKEDEATPENSASPEPAPEPLAEEPAAESPAALPISEPSNPKPRFCKLCGAPIDPAARKCTGCGKQYFRPPVLYKKHIAIAAGVLVCVAAAFLIFSLSSRLRAADAQIAELNSQITNLENKVAEQERKINIHKGNESSYRSQLSLKDETIDELRDENTMLKEFLSFYDKHVAFIGDTGAKIYHKLACPYMDMDDGFYIFSIPYVEDRNYIPCPHCCD